MKYCSNCGSMRIQRTLVAGEVGLRHFCSDCHTIHFHNPNIVAGCIATWNGRVLLCQRAIEPFRSMWTVPAGYMEMGETVEEAARREALEEAQARLAGLRLFAVYNLPAFGEVYMLYSARLLDPAVAPGDETLDARLFRADEIAWDAIAFPMVREALRAWLHSYHETGTRVHTADFFWDPEGAVRIRRHTSQGAHTSAASE